MPLPDDIPAYVECAHCGRLVLIKMDGTLRVHMRRASHLPWRVRCPGSGMTPEAR